MNYATNLIDEDEICALEEPDLGLCPLCKYQDDNIIKKMSEVEKSLTGNIEAGEIYNILCNLYHNHTAPLIRQGKKPMALTPELCKEHYSKHVVNPVQQVADDIMYCCKMQRHYKKNIGVRSSHTGNITLNPHHVNEYIKLSRHKLDLVKYMNTLQKRNETKQNTSNPYAFSS
jgi:hypothetical protein